VKDVVGTHATQSSQTDQQRQQMPRTYRFVHSDGRVDRVTDLRKTARKVDMDHGRRHQSDYDSYLSASETESDDPGMRSEKPVSKRQLRGLQKSDEYMRSQLSARNHDEPVYFSTNHHGKKVSTGKQRPY